MKSLSQALLVTFFLCMLSSCAGPRFNKAWQEANKEYRTGKSTPVTGPWEGTWLSAYNGHKGDLRCVVTPVGNKDSGRYLFRYWATWAGPLQGGFNAEFEVEKMGSQYHVEGQHNLGTFGSFRHEGVIQGKDFEANYHSSSGDHGNFTLQRPVQ